MSSLPPRQPTADPHHLSTPAAMQQATAKVNRFAKRDPALYPLSFLVVGMLGVAGYFFMSKASAPEVDRKYVATGLVNPWDSSDKHDTHPSQVAAFKYRYRTRDGHMEDSLPTQNEDIRQVKDLAHKFHTTE